MEKIKKPYKKQYLVPKLFKDDISDIIEIFKENFIKVRIELDEYKLDDVSDIEKIKKEQTTNFLISAKLNSEDISLQFFKKGLLLNFSDENNVIFRGVAHKINEILLKRKKTSKSASIIILPIILTLLLVFIIQYLNNFYLLMFLAILIPLSMFMSEDIIERKESMIYLTNSKNQISFFEKYKDQIFVGIICAFSGGILVFLISLLYNSLK